MDFPAPAPSEDPLDPDAIIVKADEVDEAGADISAISPSTTTSESDFNARIENRRAADAQSSPKILANAVPSPPRPLPRPILRRDGSAPAPPKQPPPAPPKEDDRNTDSLSLQQLKKLVGGLEKVEPTAYAYEYAETRGLKEEVQEWFAYTEEERLMLLRAKEDFEEKWNEMFTVGMEEGVEVKSWVDANAEDREGFLMVITKWMIENDDIATRVKGLECLSYIALGAWGDSVGIVTEADENEPSSPTAERKPVERPQSERGEKPGSQLDWIYKGTQILCTIGVAPKVVQMLKRLWENEQSVSRSISISCPFNTTRQSHGQS